MASWCWICHRKVSYNYRYYKGEKAHPKCIKRHKEQQKEKAVTGNCGENMTVEEQLIEKIKKAIDWAEKGKKSVCSTTTEGVYQTSRIIALQDVLRWLEEIQTKPISKKENHERTSSRNE